jgi:hypothetical protein
VKLRHTAPDWPGMIADLEAKGHTSVTICAAMGFGTNDSIIRHYKRGCQPMYHRGEPLVAFWCQEMGKQLADVPRVHVRKPYRVPSSVLSQQRREQKAEQAKAEAALALQNMLASLPPAAPAKRRGRPPKIRAGA